MIRLKWVGMGGYGWVWGCCWFPESTSVPPTIVDVAAIAMDADEEEYGEVIDCSEITNKI